MGTDDGPRRGQRDTDPSRGTDGGDLALVLTGGGARAAYQVGALTAIVEKTGGGLSFPIVTGVSAGAINASYLACAESMAEAASTLEQAWLELSISKVFRTGVFSIVASLARWGGMLLGGARVPGLKARAVLDTRPLRQTLSRRLRTGCIDANIAAGQLRAVALSANSYTTGRTVTFVHGASDVPLWERAGRLSVRAAISVDHVLASSALPLLFPAVALGGDYYGDGSIRQTAPLAPAIHLGARRLLAIAMRYGRSPSEAAARQVLGYPPAAQVFGALLNAVFLDALDADAERLLRINRSLDLLPPGPHPEGLRRLELLVLRPSRNLGEIASDLGHHLPGSLRFLLRGLGSSGLRSPDVLSYLLFERPYIERLMELGHSDTLARWDEVASLLERRSRADTGAVDTTA